MKIILKNINYKKSEPVMMFNSDYLYVCNHFLFVKDIFEFFRTQMCEIVDKYSFTEYVIVFFEGFKIHCVI